MTERQSPVTSHRQRRWFTWIQLKKPSAQVDNNLAADHIIALHRGVFMSFRADIGYILFLYTGFGLLLVAMAARLNSVLEIQI
jgi:hypothetical protein